MTDKQQLTPRAQAEQLLDEVAKGKKIHEKFTEKMSDEILISGQPMQYWKDKFYINIQTDNLTPQIAMQLSMKLMALNQEATFLWNTASARQQLVKHGNENVFLIRFNELVKEYKALDKRLPAQGTLENLAKIDQKDVESAKVICEVEVKFWKGILDNLKYCQSILKNASLMVATELKSAAADKLYEQNLKNQ